MRPVRGPAIGLGLVHLLSIVLLGELLGSTADSSTAYQTHLARLGAGQGSVPRWVVVTAWVTAAMLLLGASVGLLLPFAAWSVALGLLRGA